MKLKLYILPLLFLATIASLFFGVAIRGENKELASEKRPASQFPKWDNNAHAYLKDFEDYLNDQFIGREQLLFMRGSAKRNWFKSSPVPDKVLIGKNDWFFFLGENNMEIYHGFSPYSPEKLNSLVQNFEIKRRWLNSMGIELYVLVNPSKPEIYPELLPENYVRPAQLISNAEQAAQYLANNSSVAVVWPKDSLVAAKKNGPVYMQYDTHWNSKGAYISYRQLIRKIQEKFPKVPLVKPHDIRYTQLDHPKPDLLTMCALSGTVTEPAYQPHITSRVLLKEMAHPNYSQVPGNPALFYAGGPDSLPKVLVFRDSYGNDMIPYLNRSFRAATYVWSPLVYPEIVANEKPDIVVIEVVGRFVNSLFFPNLPGTVIPEQNTP